MSISEKLAKWAYGTSDKANSPQNSSEDFQRGYSTGASAGGDILAEISKEWKRRKLTATDVAFRDYKRGLWAGAFQKAEMRIAEKKGGQP